MVEGQEMKKEEMTSYERIMTAFEGGKPDRVPVLPFMRDWGTSYAGFTISEVLKNPSKYVYAQYRTLRDMGPDVIWDLMGFHSESEAMGSILKIPEEGSPSVSKFAVSDLSKDLEKLRLPNPRKDGRLPDLLGVVRSLKDLVRDEVPVIAYVQGPFRHAAMLRGTEKLLVEMKKARDKCEELLKIATDSLIIYGAALVNDGADLIMIAEPFMGADVMSKDMAAELAPHFGRLAKTLKQTGAKVFLHMCGAFNDRFDILGTIGMDAVSLDEKNDLNKAREILGPDICLIGNVNPTETLVFGKPEKVIEESKKAIAAAGKDGAFILASGCMIPDAAPKENLEALIQVAKETRY
jgi:uroporphyrinogen decarboxylase